MQVFRNERGYCLSCDVMKHGLYRDLKARACDTGTVGYEQGVPLGEGAAGGSAKFEKRGCGEKTKDRSGTTG